MTREKGEHPTSNIQHPLGPGAAKAVEIMGRVRHTSRMQVMRLIFSLLAAGCLAGCQKSAPPTEVADPFAPPGRPPEPTQAQPKLPTIRLYLGAETLDAEQALTPVQQMTGMMYRTNIQDTDAMLFVLPVQQQASFWMKNCPESISCAYISADGAVEEVHHLEKNDTNAVVSAKSDIQFVLETSDGWFTRHHIAPGTVILTDHGSLYRTYFH